MTTILITGSNRGLGFEHVRQYADQDVKIIAACRNPGAATDLQALSEAHPGKIRIISYDASDLSAADAMAKDLNGEAIDILINNAGIYGAQNFYEGMEAQAFGTMDYENWRNVLNINLLAPFRLTEALVENIAASERKTIVMMSSDLGSIGNNQQGQSYAYRSSKAALNMMTKGFSVNLKDRGITVISMAPGWCRTDLGGDMADIDPKDSIRGQQKVIAGLTQADTGGFINWKGEATAW